MWRWFKWVLLSIGIVIVGVGLLFAQPWVFLPHKHISISLPFAPADDHDAYLIPMGEMIVHNAANGNPNGHPCIDFGWDRQVAIIASADGWITKTGRYYNEGFEVDENSGFYDIKYKEVGIMAPDLHFGSRVKQGDLIGYTATNPDTPRDPNGNVSNHQQVHWEFTSASMILDRLSPMSYFDSSSLTRIDQIWANVPATDQFKSKYPDIANGYFKDRHD